MTSPNESTEDVDEPKLTYERILNDLSDITQTDDITSACLHNKLFAIGTKLGRIHIFDHQGNKVNRQELCFHLKSVNNLSIDERGEYFASLSSDRLVVYGLCDGKAYFNVMPDKPIHVVAIDPYFHRTEGGRRFVTGDNSLVLYEKGLLSGHKSTIIHKTEQYPVRSLSWHGQFIAWATDSFAQVYDVEQRAIITKIKRDSDMSPWSGMCHFCWKDKRTLLLGWCNNIKICVIKDRPRQMINGSQLKELPKKYVEIISMFETDFTISGLAPFNESLLTLSVNHPNDSPTTNNLIRPVVHILETFPNTYNELSKDILTPNKCPTSESMNQSQLMELLQKNNPYALLNLHDDGIYFIVCPKDILAARPRDYDDHIDWLIQHSMLKEAYNFARENSTELIRYTLRDIGTLYMKHLVELNTYESFAELAGLCPSICHQDQKAWDDAIKQFCDHGQLNQLLPHLPKQTDPRIGFCLNKASYNYILNQFLKNDSVSFCRAIKEIPCQLYDLQAMTDQVEKKLGIELKDLVLEEASAELYTLVGNFEAAVNIYLNHNDKNRIFPLIRNNNLLAILRERVDRLMEIDADETAKLLVENIDKIPMKEIVKTLENYLSKRYLLSYLHRLIMRDPDSCIEYHDLMVRLYAHYQPNSLLNFLKTSKNYNLEESLIICKDAKLIKEVVYLLSRMGDLRIALKYIVESQGIKEGIEFCKEHQDSDMWQDLIVYSMDKPEFISALLKNIGTHIEDPTDLIDRIPNGCEIEGLMPALVKILKDYQLEISSQKDNRDLIAKGCFSLLDKQIRGQTQGIAVKEDQLCDHCNQPLTSGFTPDNLSQTRSIENVAVGPISSTSTRATQMAPAAGNDLVVFGCHHVFHEYCCAFSTDTSTDQELADSKTLSCRVCIGEKDDDSIALTN